VTPDAGEPGTRIVLAGEFWPPNVDARIMVGFTASSDAEPAEFVGPIASTKSDAQGHWSVRVVVQNWGRMRLPRSLENGNRVRVIDLASRKELPIDTGQAISFAPAWIDDTDFVTSDRDVVAINVDGTRRLLVAAQGNCLATLFGFARSRIVFMTECTEGN
jgi:hypothetical protein